MLNPNDPGTNVHPLPWPVREGFVAETAVKLDHMQAKVERLDRESQLIKNVLVELQDNVRQADRLKAFEESLRNGREYKIDELMRSVKDAKSRLDEIEGQRAAFLNLTFRTIPAIDNRLAELGKLEMTLAQSLRRHLVYAGAAFSLLAAALAVRFL